MISLSNHAGLCEPPRALAQHEADSLHTLLARWQEAADMYDRSRRGTGPWRPLYACDHLDVLLEPLVKDVERAHLRTHWCRAILRVASDVEGGDDDEE